MRSLAFATYIYNYLKIYLFLNEIKGLRMKTNDVLTHFGGKRATAEALGLSTQAVQAWKSIIPQKQAWRIDRLTNGVLKIDEALYDTSRKYD